MYLELTFIDSYSLISNMYSIVKRNHSKLRKFQNSQIMSVSRGNYEYYITVKFESAVEFFILLITLRINKFEWN
jgi:hypothetical protein